MDYVRLWCRRVARRRLFTGRVFRWVMVMILRYCLGRLETISFEPYLYFQNMASEEGKHHLRCPLCRNVETFQNDMLGSGIYIPDR